MTDTFKDIEKLEADLWEAADNLSCQLQAHFQRLLYASAGRDLPAPCGQPLRGSDAPDRGGSGRRPYAQAHLLPADYLRRRALWLPEAARYDWIMQQAATSGSDLPRLVTEAMTAIEAEFKPLDGVLPKDYGIFEPKVLEDLMRLFNSAQIKQATGDVFGRIYEYFLAKFSIQKAHDNGEFFTPSSLVQTIVNVIEPDHGTVFDPACGSGGMFVQSSHFIEHEGGEHQEGRLLWPREEPRYHPHRQDEPRRSWPGRQDRRGHHLLPGRVHSSASATS